MERKAKRPAKGSQRPIIGWREWAALPDLEVPAIKVKVDTGARTSALHAFDLRLEERRGGTWVAHFIVHPMQRNSKESIEVRAPVKEFRAVRSSSGAAEERPVIETRVRLMGETWPIELTLTRRDEMGFRMLLGREAVRRRFYVDPGRSFYGKKEQLRLAGSHPSAGTPTAGKSGTAAPTIKKKKKTKKKSGARKGSSSKDR